MDARGLGPAHIIEGASRSSTEELASETLAADRVVAF
jgi:sulfur relay (sulfurtransferase) complex TusBCD TusD component (DsrE family)